MIKSLTRRNTKRGYLRSHVKKKLKIVEITTPSICGAYFQQFDQHQNEGWFPVSGPSDWCLGYIFGPLSFYSLPLQGWAPIPWSLAGSLTESTQLQSWPDHTFPKTCQKLTDQGDSLSCLTEFVQSAQKAGRRKRAQRIIFFLHNFSNKQVSPPDESNPMSMEKSHLPKQLQ